MAESDVFERRLRAALLRHVDGGPTTFDAAAFAHLVAMKEPRRHGLAAAVAWRGFAVQRLTWVFLLVAALITALVAAMLVVGSPPLRKLPAVVPPVSPVVPSATPISTPSPEATQIDVPPGELSASAAAALGVPVLTPSALGPISWTVWLPQDFASNPIPVSTSHGPVFIAGANLIWRSSSGAWHAAPIHGSADWPGAVVGDDLVVLDGQGFHWNGSDWVRAAPLEGLNRIGQPVGLVAGLGRVVAFGSAGIASSVDGIRFTPAIDWPITNGATTGASPAAILSMVVSGDRFVALPAPPGADLSVLQDLGPIPWTSTDGLTWQPAAKVTPFGTGATITGVASNGSRQVAVGVAPPAPGAPLDWATAGLQAAIWVSDDGLTWQRLPTLSDTPCGGPTACTWATGFRTVAASDAGWTILAALDGRLWTSGDGLTWEAVRGWPTVWGGWVPPIVAMGSDLIAVGPRGVTTREVDGLGLQMQVSIGAIRRP